jgi:hypothetical protein
MGRLCIAPSGENMRRTRLKMLYYASVFWVLAGYPAGTAGAVQLHNWRLPYYIAVAEMELLPGSPSGMFWDELGPLPFFDFATWPDTAALKRNHWTIEPAYAIGVERPAPASGRPLFWKLEVRNDIRYRSLSAHQTLHADRRYDYDPLYPANRDRFTRGRIEDAYLQLDWRYGFIRFGRLLRNWGPFIDRSIVLSANPYTYDALEWQVHSSAFEFRHLFAAFTANEHFPDSADNLTGRFLAAHALNVVFGRWATIGITETVVFRRADGSPDFQYVNPFSVYSVTNTNQEGKANLMLGFQWNVHPGLENLSLRGQCALDDFQVDSKQITDREPTHWGLDAGVYWRDCLPLRLHHLLKAGYQRRSEWIYTVMDRDRAQGEEYTYLSKGLGAPRNDGDSVWAGFSVIGKKWWIGSAGFSYARQGEKTDTSRWLDSDPVNLIGLPYDYRQNQFPSGTVQSTITFSLDGAAYYKNLADARFSLANRWVRNKNNKKNSSFVYDPVVSFAVGIHFNDLFVRLPE